MTHKQDTAMDGPRATVAQLFLGFGMIGILGFGGVGPWVRWLLVERTGWYTEEEFVNTFALANFIPGGNVIALATIAGVRLRGWPGAAAAIVGLCLPPAFLVCGAGSLYLRYSDTDIAQRMLGAMAAAGAGLILAMAIKLMKPMRGSVRGLGMTAAVFAAAFLLHLPLVTILLVLGPVSLALALVMRS